ncbi:MAG: SPOR domain-containing protein [Alphaproteobacteria bacterium]
MTSSRAFTRVLAICAALVLGMITAQPAHANFEDGVRAYLAQDYGAALEAWRPLAEEGHAPAQFGMGLSYENGRGVERDPTQAAIWYRKAAEQGLADAQFNLGNLYLNASGVPEDPVEAVRWFRRAADQDMPHAQVNLGYSYETGSGVAKDPVKAVSWYRRAAEQNFPQAQYYLGAAYERGSGLKMDLSLAAAWYERAAELGVVLAAKRLDSLRKKGIEPAMIDTVGATAQNETSEPEAPAMAEKAPPTEPSAVAAAKETNLIESAPPLEPEARREAAPQTQAAEAAATANETASATARAGERVTTLYGSFRLRLASYRQPANAEKGWRILSKKHKDLLSALNYAVAEVDLGAEKGIYHRLETGPFGSLEEAAATCAEIKSRGDSCVVVRP